MRYTEKTDTPTARHERVTYANVMGERSDFEFWGKEARSI